MLYNLREVKVDDVKEGMVIGRDIPTRVGMILVGEGTKLTSGIIKRLKYYDIAKISIIELDTQEAVEHSKSLNIKKPTVGYTKKAPNFSKFEDTHSKQTEMIKNEFYKIGAGSTIEIFDIFSLTNEIVSHLNSKGQIFGYLSHLKNFDDSTFAHCINVGLLCNVFSSWLNLKSVEVVSLTSAGTLHDIGKIEVDENILKKPSKLTNSEYIKIQQHAVKGYRILEKQDIAVSIKMAALMHHEKIDGSGYPMSIMGNKISSFAKIVSIVDLYEAMTADRVYRKKLCPFEVIKMFERDWYSVLDTKYLMVFLEHIAYNYLGFDVLLSNNENAEILYINKYNLSKPIVRLTNGEFVDLARVDNLSIVELL